MLTQVFIILLYVLPIPLAILFWRLYLLYIRTDYISKLEWVLLEIKLPREISKSPAAMEIVLTALHQPSEGNLIAHYTQGQHRAWFSLELVSIGGHVHFFVYTQKKFKDLIEAQIYSQYPGVEVKEADDYTQFVPFGAPGSDWAAWGAELQFTKDDAYPIKTYVDYGLDKNPDEEFKIDPLTPVLEFLGSVGPKDQIWIQIPLMATRDRFDKPGKWFAKQGWKDEAAAVIKKIVEKHAKPDKDGKPVASESNVPKAERDVIDAINRSLTRYGFDCGIRVMYLAPQENFNPTNISRLLSAWKQYGAMNLNGFKPLRATGFDYPWQDPFGTRVARMKQVMFEAYRQRGYFFWPFAQKPMIMNTEELATIFHFPGQVAETPTLGRIESKRGEPPANLPLERWTII